jgi:transposase
MLVSQRTQLLNSLRRHLTEIGVIVPQGLRYARELAELIQACDETIPFEVCEALTPLVAQLRNLNEAIAQLDRIIAQKDETAPADEHSRFLARSPPRRRRRPFGIRPASPARASSLPFWG